MKYLAALILILFTELTFSQCSDDYHQVDIEFNSRWVSSSFDNIVSWQITDLFGNVYHTGVDNANSICLPKGICFQFVVNHGVGTSFLNAQTVNQSNGYFKVYVDSELQVDQHNVEIDEQVDFDISCEQGISCEDTFLAELDVTYSALYDDTWYSF